LNARRKSGGFAPLSFLVQCSYEIHEGPYQVTQGRRPSSHPLCYEFQFLPLASRGFSPGGGRKRRGSSSSGHTHWYPTRTHYEPEYPCAWNRGNNIHTTLVCIKPRSTNLTNLLFQTGLVPPNRVVSTFLAGWAPIQCPTRVIQGLAFHYKCSKCSSYNRTSSEQVHDMNDPASGGGYSLCYEFQLLPRGFPGFSLHGPFKMVGRARRRARVVRPVRQGAPFAQ
jgi:hypothetical protein